VKLPVKVILNDEHVTWLKAVDADGMSVWGRGYAIVEDQYVEGQALVDHVRKALAGGPGGIEQEKGFLGTLNGTWGVVITWADGKALAAADRNRKVPLFYAATGREFIIGCSGQEVGRAGNLGEVNETSALEFLLAGVVSLADTLWKGVQQLQPGEMVEFNAEGEASGVRATRYYRYLPSRYSTASESQLQEEFEGLLMTYFTSLVEGMAGRRIYVPLSGGYDSRTVAALLKRCGATDVVCYCYGKLDNPEPKISKQVAEALGYPWRYIEYTGQTWDKWMASPEMREYWRYASKGVSCPVFQDFPAVMTLLKEDGIPEGSVFFAGHSGDMMAGGDIPPSCLAGDGPSVEDEIFRLHYCFWPLAAADKKETLMRKICETVAAPNQNKAARYELWNGDNKQARYVVNSTRAYEFIGASWMTFWDNRIVDFFLNLPVEQKFGRRFYLNALKNRIYRGPAAALAEIPCTSGTWWNQRGQLAAKETAASRRAKRIKSAAKAVLGSVGLLHAVRNRWHRHAMQVPMLFQWWFSRGQDPRLMTVAEALKPYGTLDRIPASAQAVLKPHLKMRLDLAKPQGLVASIALGELISRQQPSAGS